MIETNSKNKRYAMNIITNNESKILIVSLFTTYDMLPKKNIIPPISSHHTTLLSKPSVHALDVTIPLLLAM